MNSMFFVIKNITIEQSANLVFKLKLSKQICCQKRSSKFLNVIGERFKFFVYFVRDIIFLLLESKN